MLLNILKNKKISCAACNGYCVIKKN